MRIIVKDVIGYEGLYIIDSIGNVVSMPRQQGSRFVNQYKILGVKINRNGYAEVALSKDGVTKTKLLHRLLAQHFIENPDNLPCVNHKNGVKADNRLENLEWCTRQYNTKHAYDNNIGNFREFANVGLAKMNKDTQYVLIKLVSPAGEELEFDGTAAAANYLGCCQDDITRAIRKSQKVRKHLAFGLRRADLR